MSRSRKKVKKPAQHTVELTPDEVRELIQAVQDDLRYLQRQDFAAPSRTDVRLWSSVLRRLLHEGLFGHAWRFAGFSGEPEVPAIDLDAVLGVTPRRYIQYAYAGGADTAGASHKGYVLLMVPKAEAELEGAERVAARIHGYMTAGATRRFPLSDFCQSPCVLSGPAGVSRVELVRYIANKLGGVHWDNTRQAWTHPVGSRHRLLDERHVYVGKLSAPFYELVSIASAVAAANDTSMLVNRIDELVPEEPEAAEILRFREGRLGTYNEMKFGPKPSSTD